MRLLLAALLGMNVVYFSVEYPLYLESRHQLGLKSVSAGVDSIKLLSALKYLPEKSVHNRKTLG